MGSEEAVGGRGGFESVVGVELDVRAALFVRRRKPREETLVVLVAKPIQGCGTALERVVLQYHSSATSSETNCNPTFFDDRWRESWGSSSALLFLSGGLVCRRLGFGTLGFA